MSRLALVLAVFTLTLGGCAVYSDDYHSRDRSAYGGRYYESVPTYRVYQYDHVHQRSEQRYRDPRHYHSVPGQHGRYQGYDPRYQHQHQQPRRVQQAPHPQLRHPQVWYPQQAQSRPHMQQRPHAQPHHQHRGSRQREAQPTRQRLSGQRESQAHEPERRQQVTRQRAPEARQHGYSQPEHGARERAR
ncbi:MAG: hypothetical protein E6Q71_05480 [Pseudomonas sp.]|nr:MAG: hypothetical protein E6Q71_05480 [Pseudomonas sp.]